MRRKQFKCVSTDDQAVLLSHLRVAGRMETAQTAASLASILSDLVAAGDVGYPFKTFFHQSPEHYFRNLQSYSCVIDHSRFSIPNVRFSVEAQELFDFRVWLPDEMDPAGGRRRWTAFVAQPNDYESIDTFVDLFQEPERLRAKRSDQPRSPLDTFLEDASLRRDVFASLLGHGSRPQPARPICPHEMREELYRQVKECSQFKPSLVLSVFQFFRARRVFDFSAGWGDRLAGALACESIEHYVAVDPNKRLEKGHNALRAAVLPLLGETRRASARFDVIYEPFPDASLLHILPEQGGREYFDLVFTSPPFFSFEIYNRDDPNQSVAAHPELNDWLVRFLFASMARSWSLLQPRRAHMVLHITDVFRTRVCEAMCLFAAACLPGCSFDGVLASWGAAEKPRPMWVFGKSTERPQLHEGRVASARHAFWNLYPALAQRVETDENWFRRYLPEGGSRSLPPAPDHHRYRHQYDNQQQPRRPPSQDRRRYDSNAPYDCWHPLQQEHHHHHHQEQQQHHHHHRPVPPAPSGAGATESSSRKRDRLES